LSAILRKYKFSVPPLSLAPCTEQQQFKELRSLFVSKNLLHNKDDDDDDEDDDEPFIEHSVVLKKKNTEYD
jgi:hypothetical protein